MGARNGSERDQDAPADNAVERSLDDFIARANTALPPPTTGQAAAIRSISRKRKKKDGDTLVVLGSQLPLAEVTEIVSRLPAGDLDEPPRRGWFSLRLGLAFAAGAAVVLIITRFLTGSPEPVKPVAAPPPPPPIVVEPMPLAPAPPPAAPEPAPAPVEAAAPALEPASPAAKPAPAIRKKTTRPARKPDKKPSGLVDPFAE